MSDKHTAHLTPEEVEQWAEGLLPAARAIHLSQCDTCLTAAERERQLFLELSNLEHLAPRPGFADRVIDQVHIETPAEEREQR
ncbi:MAG TPA: hypothetical protein VLV45_14370 [Gemmatimonadales bacterium]|nr:hypothetical protein [Gemmatimonadales bacterium]